jgi:glycosyltransferase involved in cell wall biosynthesis
MRVLLLTNYFPPHYTGGAEVVVYHTCHGLRERGVQASVLMVNGRMAEARDVHRQEQGVSVHERTHRPYLLNGPLTQAWDPRIYGDVLAELRRIQPDLVHVHNVSGASLAPFSACHSLGIPVVLTLHDYWLLCPNNMLYRGNGLLCDPGKEPGGCRECFRRYDYWADIPRRRKVFAHLVRNVRTFISPSQKLVELHVAAGYDRDRFRVVPNAIKPASFQPPSDPLVRQVIRESGQFRTLLFAGALVETKGVPTLIEALPLLARYVDRFRLVVAGDGEDQMAAALRRQGQSQVRLLGRVPFQEMRALYATADLTVLPSIWYENSPMVIYESLLAGTPVLGSDIGGIPELIEEGVTGYTFPAGDAIALTEQVVRHLARPARERRSMRRRCVEQARARMTLEQHLDELQRVYAAALGS